MVTSQPKRRETVVPIPKGKLDGNVMVLGMLRKHLDGYALKMLNDVIDELADASSAVFREGQARAAREHRSRERIKRTDPHDQTDKPLTTWWSKAERVVVERHGGYIQAKIVGRQPGKPAMLRVKLSTGKEVSAHHRNVHSLSGEWWIKSIIGPRPKEPLPRARKRPANEVRWGGKVSDPVKERLDAVGELAAFNQNERAIIYELKRNGFDFIGMAQLEDRQGLTAPVRLYIYPEHKKAIELAGYKVRESTGLSIPVIPQLCDDLKWRISGSFAKDGKYHEIVRKTAHRKVKVAM